MSIFFRLALTFGLVSVAAWIVVLVCATISVNYFKGQETPRLDKVGVWGLGCALLFSWGCLLFAILGGIAAIWWR